jgi:hypothetical protein
MIQATTTLTRADQEGSAWLHISDVAYGAIAAWLRVSG